MYHGKKKDVTLQDTDLVKTLQKIYSEELNDETAEELVKLIPDDFHAQNILKRTLEPHKLLALNIQSLIANPKSYVAWHHRLYTLQTFGVTLDIITREYELVELCLESDNRNFHCWNYKRSLDKIVQNHFPHNEISKMKLKIGCKFYDENFSNYSAAHDILVSDGHFKILVSQLYTDPLDFSTWTVFNSLQERSLYKTQFFCVKVYRTKFVVCCKLIPKALSVRVNGIELRCKNVFRHTLFRTCLKKEDVVCINGIEMCCNETSKGCDEFIDEILELENECTGGFLVKLENTSNANDRKTIVNHLKVIDTMRSGYYDYLLDQDFYVVSP